MILNGYSVKNYQFTNHQIVTDIFDVKKNLIASFFSSYEETLCKVDYSNRLIYIHKGWNRSTTTKKWLNKFLSLTGYGSEYIGFEFTGKQKEIGKNNDVFSIILLDN